MQDVEGLDQQDAVARLGGNEALYVKMLRQFLELETLPRQIIERLEAGDWLAAERHAHTLKGVAGSLGARALQRLAVELELSLRGRSSSGDLLQQLQFTLSDLVERVRPILPPELREQDRSVDVEQLLIEMDALLSGFDAAALELFEANRETFRAHFSAGQFAVFERQMSHFAFDEAHNTFRLAVGTP